MTSSFQMKIAACSEAVAVGWAYAAVPFISAALDRDLKVHQITQKKHAEKYPFTDINSLDWPSSIAFLHKLAEKGVNLLILSDGFLNWDTPREFINEDLDRFEAELDSLNFSVICVDGYSDDLDVQVVDAFSRVNDWTIAELGEVIAEMVNGHRPESLCLPPGMLPYILVDPREVEGKPGLESTIKALVGFQPWQYEHVCSRWPTPSFPFSHWLPNPANGGASQDTGPIPMAITERSSDENRR